jgi:hypothetical protein
MKTLKILEENVLSQEEEQQLMWVKEKKDFIEEMNSIIKSIESVSLILKHQGLRARTAKECKKAIEKHRGFPKHLQFKRLFSNYLTENLKQRSHRKESLLCTSDVIESVFGRYERKPNEWNNRYGINYTCINIQPGRSRDKKSNRFVYMRSTQAMARKKPV